MMFSFSILAFSACQKDETQAVIDPTTIVASKLTASTSTLVLSKANQTQTAISFTFANPEFGYNAALTNVLQIAKKGTNFVTSKEVDLEVKAAAQSYSVLDFNALLLKLGLLTDVSSDIEVRLKSTLSSKSTPLYSNVVTIKVTPYSLISYLYAVGEFSGWNEKNPDSLISATSNGVYTGVLDYRSSSSKAFLFLPAKSWSHKYADAGSGKISYDSGSDIKAPTSEQYRVTADLNALTILFEKYWWGVAGDATPTGWSNNATQMKYNNGTQTWSLTVDLIGGNYFKFIQTSDWSLTNYGAKTAGKLDTENNNNILVSTSGTYKITLDIVNKTYTLVKQ